MIVFWYTWVVFFVYWSDSVKARGGDPEGWINFILSVGLPTLHCFIIYWVTKWGHDSDRGEREFKDH